MKALGERKGRALLKANEVFGDAPGRQGPTKARGYADVEKEIRKLRSSLAHAHRLRELPRRLVERGFGRVPIRVSRLRPAKGFQTDRDML